MLRLVQRLIWGLVSGILGITIWVGAVGGFNESSSLRCVDGDHFSINVRDIAEASHLEAANHDLILIEVKRCKLTYYREGTLFKIYTVAVGKRSTPSPVGEWKVVHKGGNWGGGFGTRWLGLNVPWGIYGIHGTDKPNTIGYASSHGCIRMNNRNVNELYSLVRVGTPVHITGDLPKVNFKKEYHRKETGKSILHLQFALRKAGFEPGPADARFGAAMEKAVLHLEKFYGLPEDGVISLDEQYILRIR